MAAPVSGQCPLVSASCRTPACGPSFALQHCSCSHSWFYQGLCQWSALPLASQLHKAVPLAHCSPPGHPLELALPAVPPGSFLHTPTRSVPPTSLTGPSWDTRVSSAFAFSWTPHPTFLCAHVNRGGPASGVSFSETLLGHSDGPSLHGALLCQPLYQLCNTPYTCLFPHLFVSMAFARFFH